jgi:hypothetical protein
MAVASPRAPLVPNPTPLLTIISAIDTFLLKASPLHGSMS